MSKNNLLEQFREYEHTEESSAVLFSRIHLIQAKGCWIDIVSSLRCETPYGMAFDETYQAVDKLHFASVTGGLYKRKIQPKYPAQSEFTTNGVFNKRDYSVMARAITWEAAHRDIEQQKLRMMPALKFNITGARYDKNQDNKNYFLDNAPPEIKALARNLLDRTSPLWESALKYVRRPEFVYNIKRVMCETSP